MEGYESYPSDSSKYLDMEIRTQSLADGALIELSRQKTLEEVLEIPDIRAELEEVLMFWEPRKGSLDDKDSLLYAKLDPDQKYELLKVYLSKIIIERHDSLTGKKRERLWLVTNADQEGEAAEEWRTGRGALDVIHPGESVFVGYEGFYWVDVYDSLEQIAAD